MDRGSSASLVAEPWGCGVDSPHMIRTMLPCSKLRTSRTSSELAGLNAQFPGRRSWNTRDHLDASSWATKVTLVPLGTGRTWTMQVSVVSSGWRDDGLVKLPWETARSDSLGRPQTAELTDARNCCRVASLPVKSAGKSGTEDCLCEAQKLKSGACGLCALSLSLSLSQL